MLMVVIFLHKYFQEKIPRVDWEGLRFVIGYGTIIFGIKVLMIDYL